MWTRQGLSDDQPGDPVMEDHCLLSVGSHALTECLLAWKPVVQCGDAAFVGDNPAGHTLHSAGKIEFSNNVQSGWLALCGLMSVGVWEIPGVTTY